MPWALRRQLFYIFIFLLLVGGAVFSLSYSVLNKPPSCMDNKQNGDETGIDCGGSCALACKNTVSPLSIIWARAFRVVPGRYNAVAYVENHNKNVAIAKIKYRFRFADKNNIYIGKREGVTYVPPSSKFAVFEPALDIGNSIPVYITFEFTEVPAWTQVKEETIAQLRLPISDINLTGETTSPSMSAVIKNDSLFVVPDIDVVAILYGKSGNAVSVSKTYIDKLIPTESKMVNFTWPEPFTEPVVAKELLPLYNIFSVKLK